MKFIFPQNYKFNKKIFGFLDAQTAVVSALWGGFIYLIVNVVFKSLYIKIFLFIVTVFPVVIFSIVGFNGENIINVATYMIKYVLKYKIIIYNKNSEDWK